MGLEDDDFDALAGGDEAGGAGHDDPGSAGSDMGFEDLGAGAGAGDAPAGDAGSDDGQGDASDQAGAGDQGAAGDQGGNGQTVPLAVLLEERRGFQERIDSMNQKMGRFEMVEKNLQNFMEQREAFEKAKEQIPVEYLDDPKAYIDQQVKLALDAANANKADVTELRQAHEQTSQLQQITNRLQTYDLEFSKSNPDYMDAMDYVRQVNIQNGLDMGLTQEQAAQQAAQAIFMTQAQVASRGKDPAQYMYSMAKRWGYQAKVADDPGKTADDGGLGDEFDAAAAGAKAQSMGGGAAPDSENIMEMEDDEFSEAMSELFGSEFVR